MRTLWICTVILSVTVLTVYGAASTKYPQLQQAIKQQQHQLAIKHQHQQQVLKAKQQQQQQHQHLRKHQPVNKQASGGNQRIIKIQGTSQANQFNGHHKHVRSRPVVTFPKNHGKDEFSGPKHHLSASFFNGQTVNHLKHLSRPPPHVFHKLPSYGSGFPYKSVNTFRTTLGKPPFRKPSQTITQARPVTVKQAAQVAQVAQVSHVTPAPSISQASTKTTSVSASYYSPTFTSFSFGSGPVRHIISSDDNNGPIREVPAPDLSPKGAGISFDASHLAHVNSDLFTGFKDASGAAEGLLKTAEIEALIKTPPIETYIKTPSIELSSVKSQGIELPSSIIKDSNLDVSHYVKDSFSGLSNGATSFGADHTIEVSSLQHDGSIDVSGQFKDGLQSEKHGSTYEVTEHHHVRSNDHIIKSHDGTKLYYAPDPDPSLPVYKVPPTNDPHSTPSYASLYLSQIPNGYSYIQGGSLGDAVATLTSEELYQLMQGYPTVLSQVSYVSQPQSNILVSGPEQNYYHHDSSSSTGSGSGSSSSVSSVSSSGSGSSTGLSSSAANPIEVGDITQYLQNPEIHNLLHNSGSHYEQDSSHASATRHATHVRQPSVVYSPQNQYKNYFQSSRYKSNAFNNGAFQSSGPQTFDTSEGGYEPEASESRTSVTVIRQTNEGTVGASDKDSLPEDSDSNDLDFSISEEPETIAEDEPQIYHFKNIPEVPSYSSLPSEEAAKTLAGLQAAGSVASNFLNKVKATGGNENPQSDNDEVEVSEHGQLEIEEVTAQEDHKNMGYYQFSGFKKLNEDSNERAEDDVESVTVSQGDGEEEQLKPNETNDNHSVVGEISSASRRRKFSPTPKKPKDDLKDESSSKEQDSDELDKLDFKQTIGNETFGKRLRPK